MDCGGIENGDSDDSPASLMRTRPDAHAETVGLRVRFRLMLMFDADVASDGGDTSRMRV